DEAQRDELQGLIRSNPGQPYSDFNIATDQDAVLNYFFNNGYSDATFEATVKPAANPNRMDVLYVVTPGERQFVRQVLYSGLKTTDAHLVEDRLRNLTEGSPLSQQAMNESQRKLYDLGVFA